MFFPCGNNHSTFEKKVFGKSEPEKVECFLQDRILPPSFSDENLAESME